MAGNNSSQQKLFRLSQSSSKDQGESVSKALQKLHLHNESILHKFESANKSFTEEDFSKEKLKYRIQSVMPQLAYQTVPKQNSFRNQDCKPESVKLPHDRILKSPSAQESVHKFGQDSLRHLLSLKNTCSIFNMDSSSWSQSEDEILFEEIQPTSSMLYRIRRGPFVGIKRKGESSIALSEYLVEKWEQQSTLRRQEEESFNCESSSYFLISRQGDQTDRAFWQFFEKGLPKNKQHQIGSEKIQAILEAESNRERQES